MAEQLHVEAEMSEKKISYFNGVIKYLGWMVASSFVYIQFLIQTSASIMQDDWAAYFHLSPLRVSYLSASFYYSYLAFQIPVGVIYDRFNAKIVLALSSLGLGIGCLLFASTMRYEMALIYRMLMGACAAFGFIGMLKITADYFPGKQFSMMMGISEAFASFCTMLGVTFLAWMITIISWQRLTNYFAFCVFFITICVLLFVRPATKNNVDDFNMADLVKNTSAAVMNPIVLVSGIYGFFMFAVVNAFNSLWGAAFLTGAYAISEHLAAKVMSTVFLGLAVGCPISGYVSKKYGHEREAMLVCALVSAVCMTLIIYLKMPLIRLYLLFFIIGLTCAIYVQSFAVVSRSVPSKIQATAMAVTNMLIMMSAPILQILIGAILESHSFGWAQNSHQNYQIALGVLPLGMVIAFILSFFLKVEKN